MRSKFTLKTTLQQSNANNTKQYTRREEGCQGECPGGQLLERNSTKDGCKRRRLEINTPKPSSDPDKKKPE